MKSVRKIFPAIAMLIVSAVMLTTASFAWLAMNPDVEATGMNATVRSDSIFLLIASANEGDTYTADQVQTGNKTTVTGTAIGRTDILPSAYYKTGGPDPVGTGKNVTTGTDLANVANWYYGSSNDSSVSTMSGEAQSIGSTFDGYVVRYKYFVTMEDGSPEAANLVVSSLTITDTDTSDSITDVTPVKVLVQCGEKFEEFDSTTAAGSVDLSGDAKVDSTTALEVWVYVFYDGNHEKVTTNDIATLAGVTVDLTLLASN